jgi:hypothetical protein
VAEKYSKQATPLGYAERNESSASTSICRNMTGNKREIIKKFDPRRRAQGPERISDQSKQKQKQISHDNKTKIGNEQCSLNRIT